MFQIAVVGVGHWGPNLVRNFDDQIRSQVRYVVDVDEGRLEAVRCRYPHINTSSSFEDVLNDPAVDAVVIATPTVTHAELVLRALQADKDVLVEKPLTMEASSSRELVQLAEERERVLLVGHVFLFNPAVQWVKRCLEEGGFGRLYYLSSVRTNLGPVRVDVNSAWDLASQDISIFNYWLGSPPGSVSALGHDWVNPGVHDAVFATLRYPCDILVHLHVSWINPRKVRHITLVAEDRMLTYDDMSLEEPIRIFDKRVTEERAESQFIDTFAGFRSVVHTGDITIPPVRMGEPLRNECMHFLDCIEKRQRPLVGGPEALDVVRALEAFDRSMANGGQEEPV